MDDGGRRTDDGQIHARDDNRVPDVTCAWNRSLIRNSVLESVAARLIYGMSQIELVVFYNNRYQLIPKGSDSP